MCLSHTGGVCNKGVLVTLVECVINVVLVTLVECV